MSAVVLQALFLPLCDPLSNPTGKRSIYELSADLQALARCVGVHLTQRCGRQDWRSTLCIVIYSCGRVGVAQDRKP